MVDVKDHGTTAHFNRLTEAEAERLAKLAEECAEVIQVCMKILRHGWESVDWTQRSKASGVPAHYDNRRELENEIEDMAKVVHLMVYEADLYTGAVSVKTPIEEILKNPYWHHQRQVQKSGE